MAEQRNQTPAGDNTQWTTIIRPRTGWFDVDLEELWRYRDLIVMFVKRNFTVMYKQTILGPLWIILNPLITTVLFNVVFGGIAGLSTDGTPSFLFYMAGNTVWTFFASCINGTANTFVANSQVFGKVYFPRLTTPISQVLTSLINFFIQFVMYILFWVYFAVTGSGVHLTAWAFAVPLVVLEVMLLGLGVGIIVSALTTKYRDLAIAVSFGVQLWMYISPVVYPLSSLEESPRLQMLMRLNPMTAPIEVFRMGTLGTGTVEVGSLIYSLIVTASARVLGVVLDQGRVIFDGDVEQAIAVYMETTDVNVVHYDLLDVSRMNASAGKRMRLETLDFVGKESSVFADTEKIRVRITWRVSEPFTGVHLKLNLHFRDSIPVGITHPVNLGAAVPGKLYTTEFEFDPSLLGEGQYFFYVDVFDGVLTQAVCLDKPVTEFAFEVTSGDLTMPEWAPGWGRIHFPPVKVLENGYDG